MIGDESHWLALALGGFVFAVLAFTGGVIVAARSGQLAPLASGIALGIAGFVATIVAAFVTHRLPASGERTGEAVLPFTWGIAWGFYAFGALLLLATLLATRRTNPPGH